LIGYEPLYPLEKGFPRYIEWYKKLYAENPGYFG
jgi:nucleoside-diphosphate-sugar epimerase